jgi:hypothetical protein
MTTTQRNAIASPATGLQVYNTTTNTNDFYNGTAWSGVGGMGINGSISGATSGSVLFAGTSGVLTQDNANFFWDNTNKRLGIGISIPDVDLHIKKAVPQFLLETNSNTGVADFNLSTNPLSGGNLYIRQYGNTASGSLFGFSVAKTSVILQNDANALLIGNLKSTPLIFGTNNIERARITSAGRLLLGTTTENNSALLNITSTTQGVLFPRMTTVEKLAIGTPAAGLQVYDTTLNQMSYYNGTLWVNF